MSGCSGGLNKPGSGSEDASDGVTDGGKGCVEKNHPEAPEDGEHCLDDPHDRSDDPHVQDGEDAEKEFQELDKKWMQCVKSHLKRSPQRMDRGAAKRAARTR